MFFWALPSLFSLFALSPLFRSDPDNFREFDRPTRYMALGDSLAAGYGAVPATLGYVYLLYRSNVFNMIDRMLFCNAGVPGATSLDVLEYQVPQAIDKFRPTVITVSVGGNDLIPLIAGEDFGRVFETFRANLIGIFHRLQTELPAARIYTNNLYTIPDIPETRKFVPALNDIISSVAGFFRVPVADVHGAFLGKKGLLLIERDGAPLDEVHPSNEGYRVIAEAYKKIIRR